MGVRQAHSRAGDPDELKIHPARGAFNSPVSFLEHGDDVEKKVDRIMYK